MRDVSITNQELDFAPASDAVEYRELAGVGYAVKGVVDRLTAAVALVVLAAPMAAIAILVKASSPGPILVRQTRVGRFGHRFTFYKFRSMRQDAEQIREEIECDNEHDTPLIFKMRRDPRITRFGAFLRRTSLDELPNLFNVLKGEMSLVGPRPPLPREVAHYEPRHMQRLATTPGITGLWQIRGRSEVGFDQMVALDIEYIERWSLWLDMTILLQTPFAVANGRGAW